MESRLITQTFRRGNQAVIVEDIPAYVCDLCGFELLDPWVVDQILQIDPSVDTPVRFAPVFKFGLQSKPAA